MARATTDDPIKVFRYRVQIPGIGGTVVVAGFSEVTIPAVEFDVVEYREGGDPTTPQKSPGLAKFDDITLRRGQFFSGKTTDTLFYDWVSRVYDLSNINGPFETSMLFRIDFTLLQMRNDGTLAAQWAVRQAWPRRYKPAGDQNATSSENSIEELVIAHEGFYRMPL